MFTLEWLRTFSTRELAVGAWLAVLGLWALTHAAVRKSLANLVSGLLAWKLLIPGLVMAGYTASVCWLLQRVGLWDSYLLKDTVLWFCFSGLSLGFAFGSREGTRSWWRRVLWDQVKIIVVLEYLASVYTFSLAAELVLQPVLLAVVLMDAVGKTKPELAPATKVTGVLLAVLGFTVFAITAFKVLSDPWTALGAQNLHTMLLPPILTLAFIPIAYLFHLLVAYETLFLRIGFAIKRDKRLLRYAKWRLLRALGFSLARVQAFTRSHAIGLFEIRHRSEVDNLITLSRQAGRDLRAS